MAKNINELQSNEQKWLAKAVVSIILADPSVKKTQTGFIKQMFRIFLDEEPVELLSEISALLKKGTNPKINKIEITDPEKLILILDILSASVFVNGKRMHLETERFYDAGKKLGFRMGMLSYRLSLEVEKERVKRKLAFINDDIKKEFKAK